ncbi:hypothetical protein ACQP0I_22190 [Micromonospora carbonacea]|uniref:hypothetical protein n=1 Tax=Micromonospora carbonacea TaxID=47853 RepID=UPI003D98DBE6
MTGPDPDEAASAADRLHPVVLLHHIVNTLGWPRPRGLQERAANPLLAGNDVLLLAVTACGKTDRASSVPSATAFAASVVRPNTAG